MTRDRDEPSIRVEKGRPTNEELGAVIAVLLTRPPEPARAPRRAVRRRGPERSPRRCPPRSWQSRGGA